MPTYLAGFPVLFAKLNDKQSTFTIILGKDERIVLSTFKDMVSVKVDHADSSRFHNSTGLMGEYGTGKLVGRDGVTVIPDTNSFGQEWQVRFDEPKLFQTLRDPQHPKDHCIMPSEKNRAWALARKKGLGKSIALDTAKKACAHRKENHVHGLLFERVWRLTWFSKWIVALPTPWWRKYMK